jgi:hypothetical protein
VPGNLVDWEDIAADASGNLYLADTGTNGMVRTHVAVHRVGEPNPYKRYGNARINRSWYLRFPEGPIQDCEAFFVHGSFGYLINKRRVGDLVNLYRFSLADTRRSIPLRLVTRIPVESSVTAADLSVDNQRLALTTSDGVYLYFINGKPASAASAQRVFFRFDNDFMEGGTFFRNGFLTSAETGELWLFTDRAFLCRERPRFDAPLTNRTVLVGAPVRFQVSVTGCPFPGFTWRFNGQLIPGATNSFLDLPSVSTNHAGIYEVIASNRYGAATNTVTLTVRSKPALQITEVMSSPAQDATVETADWWELTNFEPQPLDLSGWRFNDSIGGLTDPFVLPGGLVVDAGETIVLVENLSAEEFAAWWGPKNLPLGLQIVTYSGNGLSFRATGDTLFLWDNVSTDPADFVSRADFGQADIGVTFIYDPITDQFGAKSQLGVHGAIKAQNSSDVGSPGRIIGTP